MKYFFFKLEFQYKNTLDKILYALALMGNIYSSLCHELV